MSLSSNVEGALKIDSILSNIKTFSEYSDEQFDLKDINVILSSSIETLSDQIESNCRIIESYDADEPLVSCSAHQIEQLFVNLLQNSLQAIGRDLGVIKVMTSNAEQEWLFILLTAVLVFRSRTYLRSLTRFLVHEWTQVMRD